MPKKQQPKVSTSDKEAVANAAVGAVVGGIVAGPVGAVAGAAIGALVEKGPSPSEAGTAAERPSKPSASGPKRRRSPQSTRAAS